MGEEEGIGKRKKNRKKRKWREKEEEGETLTEGTTRPHAQDEGGRKSTCQS